MKKELRENIINEAKLLTELGDCVGIDLGNGKGIFIQVLDDFGEGWEYFIELNDIEDGWEPCADYNPASPYGDYGALIRTVDRYLIDNGLA